ncbi:MAG: uracil-DNA glycosylase family protein [Candidatus Cloacimonetes bacterium]|nr:uracil-DNA glycosylase family protein [Candidatus Cloacimonadota bacterium]
MQSLDSLLQEVRNCRICEDLPLGPRPVFQIDPRAKILIVGQAPGRKVHETGIPFNDPSGDRLRFWLGVNREQFYDPENFAILPMGFCYPGSKKSGDLPPRKICAPTWREKLLKHLPDICLIVCVGQYAISYHAPPNIKKKSLTETVKCFESYWPKLFLAPHPSPRNLMWLRRNPWFEAELIPKLRQRVLEIL